MAITRDEVFEAAEGLQGEGTEPTYINIRERLGSGSFSTISKYLREWKAQGKGREREGGTGEVPAEFRAALERFGAEVWRTLGAFARTEIEAARVAFEERLRERDEELERAAGTVDTLQGELEDTSRERDDLRGDRDSLRASLAKREGEVSELRDRLSSAIDERERVREEVRDLDRELSKVRERGEVLEGNLQSVRAELLTVQGDLSRRLEELAETRKERDEARVRGEAAAKVEENLRRELGKEEARVREMTSKIEDLSRLLTEEAARRAKAEERLAITATHGNE